MTTIIGVDPGLSGAIAVLREGKFSTLYDMPVEARASKGNQIDCLALHAIAKIVAATLPAVGASQHSALVVIERVSAMKGQGVSSMFSFGQSYGAARMFAHLFENAVIELVPPAQWKKGLALSGKQKDYARTRARQLYPAARSFLERKKDIGRADALLLAHYIYARGN